MRLVLDCEDLPPVIGDQDELAQVFQNLIDNALKYGHPDTAVTVSANPCPGATVSSLMTRRFETPMRSGS